MRRSQNERSRELARCSLECCHACGQRGVLRVNESINESRLLGRSLQRTKNIDRAPLV
jgi:hypothetical protein